MSRKPSAKGDRDDATIIARFETEADEMLTDRRLIAGGLNAKLDISYEDGVLTWAATDNDAEDLLAYLGSLRRFLMQGEMLYVQTIHLVARRHVTDHEFVKTMDAANKEWNTRQSKVPVNLVVRDPESGEDMTLKPEDIFDLYLNGKVAHVDEEKARLIERLESSNSEMVRWAVMDSIIEASNYIGWLLGAIRYARKEGWWVDDPVVQLRLTHAELDFYVDVRLRAFEGRWLATADLAEDRPDVGSGETPRDAIRNALQTLGEPYATEMADSAEVEGRVGS